MASTTDDEAKELHVFNGNAINNEGTNQPSSLPPADSGKDAYLTLAGCFVLEALVWGFPNSFGVFQAYFRSHEPFSRDPSTIAAISTTASGLMYLSSPLAALAIQRWPRFRRSASFVGLIVTAVALIAASFAKNAATLLATQGVLYAIGGLTLYFPAMYVIDEWFIKRKGLAFGIVWTGTGVAGAVVPFLLHWLLDLYGFRTALRVWAIMLLILGAPSTYLMKNRLPISAANTLRPIDLSFTKTLPFWLFEAGNFTASLSYFLPLLWIPSFSQSQGFPSFVGPLALCLLSIAACGGYLLQGALCDRFHVTVAIFVASLGAAVSILVFWGLTTSQAMLYVFAVFWGLTGGAFAGNWSGCAMAMKSPRGSLDTGMVISLMCAGKGVAALIAGPISEMLLRAEGLRHAGFAYGSQYGGLIVFAGATALLGGTACMGRLFKLV